MNRKVAEGKNTWVIIGAQFARIDKMKSAGFYKLRTCIPLLSVLSAERNRPHITAEAHKVLEFLLQEEAKERKSEFV